MNLLSKPADKAPPKPNLLQKMPAAPEPPASSFYNPYDPSEVRKEIYGNVLNAARSLPPIKNTRHTLELVDVKYDDDADDYEPTPAEHKEATLAGRSLGRRMSGTWRLLDNTTGKVLDEKRQAIARVPAMTKLGTFIHNGTQYAVIHQKRQKAGVYTRRRQSGEYESHLNALPGQGISHRYTFDPAKGTFHINIEQAKIPLMPLLRAMNVTDTQLREAWGDEVLAANKRYGNDATAIGKFYDRVVSMRDKVEGADKAKLVVDAFQKVKIDPYVSRKTLGREIPNLDASTIVDITKKLMRVSRGEEQVDNRDALNYQTIMGPADLFAERLSKDYGRMRSTMFRKASLRGNLSPIATNALSRQLDTVLLNSGLANAMEEINPGEHIDKLSKITSMGEGGLATTSAIPMSARNVQDSYYGLIDPVRTVESLRIGIDGHLTSAIRKGRDGRLYAPFKHVRSGKVAYVSGEDLADSVLSFPKEMDRKTKRVIGIRNGKIDFVSKDDVDYVLPDFEKAFSPLGSLVPFKSAMKPGRMSMASRMLTQALSLENGEAPLVRTGVPGEQGASFENKLGDYFGAVRAKQGGRVVSVNADTIKVQYADGTKANIDLFNNMPLNRKSVYSQTPLVQPGDQFTPGQTLARSNYTDKDGTMAVGANLRVGYVAHDGFNFEDAIVISRSAATKRLRSEHGYQHNVTVTPDKQIGKKQFLGYFAGKYDRSVLDKLDDDGVIKPGSLVNFGDPVVLGLEKRQIAHNKIVRGNAGMLNDASDVWEHESQGIVTDVHKGKKGVTVVVKSLMDTNEGDKLCYDAETEALTLAGWKPVSEITENDLVASLREDHSVEYLHPLALRAYRHAGPMYCLETTQVSLCVTDNHKLYAKRRNSSVYCLQEARNLFGRRFKMKRNGAWFGTTPESVTFPALKIAAGQGGVGSRELPPIVMPAKTYLMLLGMYLSEGSLINQPDSGSYGIKIDQVKPAHRAEMIAALDAAGVKYYLTDTKSEIYSKQLMLHFEQFGYCYEKFIPREVFGWDTDALRTLYTWMMWGDGCETGTSNTYHTTSAQLADDFQQLLLHIGWSGNIDRDEPYVGEIKGKEYQFRARYRISVYRQKNEPEINHGHAKRQNGQSESWQQYEGMVYCVTLPRNHVLYVRRKGKPVWCGNSGRMGDKGTISRIVEDEDMPIAADGKPLEILVNPLGLNSRVNVSQVIEAALGKIAAKTGKPYNVADFETIEDATQFAMDEMKKHGIKLFEPVHDPRTGRTIPGALVGNRWFMKLHHQAESKAQGRGTGGYSADDSPSAGSKRLSLLDANAHLAYGAYKTLGDSALVKGQRNEDYWLALMQGKNPPKPAVATVYKKMVAQAAASGIKIVDDGQLTNFMSMTDKDVAERSGGREITSGDTVDFENDMKPVRGGLFDEAATGGHNSERWSMIRLPEPMPSPVMEEPIRRLLGVTKKTFQEVLAGRGALPNGKTGPQGIKDTLAAIDLDKQIAQCITDIGGTRKGKRDEAIRRLKYLQGAKKTGVHPKEWMLETVPVLPTKFRPVSQLGEKKLPLIADANYLYKDLLENIGNFKALQGQIDDVGDERLAVYNSFKAITGLGDPTHPKLVEKNVKGLLRSIFGNSPKFSAFQRQLLSNRVDLVGRGVVVPDPDLDMDSLGIPENQAWDLYKIFTIRRLRRRGMPLADAARHVRDRTPLALHELQAEMKERPVKMVRAPVLHKFGVAAFIPHLIKGNAVRVSPLIVKPYNMDFDGDAVQYHVAATDDEVQEAMDLMRPSKNLISPADFKTPAYMPSQEYVGGLYTASSNRSGKPRRYFRSLDDLLRAAERGEIDVTDEVEIPKL